MNFSKSSTFFEINNNLQQSKDLNFIKKLKLLVLYIQNAKNIIDAKNLEENSNWNDWQDSKLKIQKLKLGMKIQRYRDSSAITTKYLKEIPLIQWVKEYFKLQQCYYKPGKLKDVNTAIQVELNKMINNQDLEDETDSLEFHYVMKLGEGSFGIVTLVKTNTIIIGVEVEIAVKSSKIYSNDPKQSIKAKMRESKAESEFDLLYSMHHQNIMKAYQKWRTSQNQFKMALEYWPWNDLSKLAKKYKAKYESK